MDKINFYSVKHLSKLYNILLIHILSPYTIIYLSKQDKIDTNLFKTQFSDILHLYYSFKHVANTR